MKLAYENYFTEISHHKGMNSVVSVYLSMCKLSNTDTLKNEQEIS